MKHGPDIALVASLVGEPARANMLVALLSGCALTASELAQEAGITAQTASAHLAKLESGGLVVQQKQGRHRYFQLSGEDVGALLESLMGIAARAGHLRVRPGPKEPELRRSRVCYDHLAGELGVQLFDSLSERGLIAIDGEAVSLTASGEAFAHDFGIELAPRKGSRRPLCRACLDWSERRSHLAGLLGAGFLARFYALKWARRMPDSRIVRFTPEGERQFNRHFAPV